MYFANSACAADNSVWVLPTASFDLEHASSGCKSALWARARRRMGFQNLRSACKSSFLVTRT
jgi:hypothetical protein